MKLGFSEPQRTYDSGSQSARAVTETWVAESLYCPNCGNPKLNQFPPNLPVADFFCGHCQDQFKLKSQKKDFSLKIINGAYETKLQRLNSDTSPNLILLRYDNNNSEVKSLCVIPKRFFISSIVEKRKPLSPTARRAGWIGSNILIGKIPASGRVFFVKNGTIAPKELVLEQWKRTAFLSSLQQSARGWLIEVMNCVDQLDTKEFSLNDIYNFEVRLARIYPGNNNVRPKIRQQLQILRDNGYLEFLGKGRYRLGH